ncbi:TPA: hypothetical protein LA460_000305 [Clostridium botulinum]|nr:hypothetical protein [Clostridium botulinum]HBJ1652909.1 hypothetical protein [Clostridium botulinum]
MEMTLQKNNFENLTEPQKRFRDFLELECNYCGVEIKRKNKPSIITDGDTILKYLDLHKIERIIFLEEEQEVRIGIKKEIIKFILQ